MALFKITLCLCITLLLYSCGGSKEVQQEKVIVFKSNFSIQCQYEGISLEYTAGQLENQGIEVYNSFCGVMSEVGFSAACGNETGIINLHEIETELLNVARDVGFESVEALRSSNGLGYSLIDCRN